MAAVVNRQPSSQEWRKAAIPRNDRNPYYGRVSGQSRPLVRRTGAPPTTQRAIPAKAGIQKCPMCFLTLHLSKSVQPEQYTTSWFLLHKLKFKALIKSLVPCREIICVHCNVSAQAGAIRSDKSVQSRRISRIRSSSSRLKYSISIRPRCALLVRTVTRVPSRFRRSSSISAT